MPALKLDLTPSTKQKAKPVLVQNARLDTLVEDRLIVAAKLSQLEAKKRELDADILARIQKLSGKKDGAVETADYTATIVVSSNSFVNRELLLKAGVKASVVAKCTKVTGYSYPRIDKKKAKVDIDDVLGIKAKNRG